jgi:prephenate dehydrogenase
MDRITIIGSGSIGLSMGLGIKAVGLKETELVGTSGDRKWREKATETGAFDSVSGNLGDALDGARLVIIDMPASETKDLMEAIGPVLEDDCRVTNTGLSMVHSLEWADAYFREDTTFVAGRPLLRTSSADLDAADGAAFQGVDYCIAPSSTARPDAIKTVVGLVEALGANPLFLDPHEHDSYTAAVTLMPSLISSAMMSMASESPSWREMSKLVANEFYEMSKLASVDPVELATEIETNTESVAVWISRMIETLESYRSLTQGPREQVEEALIRAWEERTKLELGAIVEDDAPRTPSTGESVASMFVGSRLAGRVRDIKDAGKNDPWRYKGKKDETAK